MTSPFRITPRDGTVDRLHRNPRSPIDLLAYLVPLTLIAALLATYLLAPDFYLMHVLELTQREDQIVEIATIVIAFLASILLFWSAWRLGWSRRGPGLRGGAVIVGMIGLATFFFAGEEISWGQTYLGWHTPETIQQLGGETNLHNMQLPFSVQGLGSLFLVMMFVGLPIAWRLRDRLPIPKEWVSGDWACAVAEGPVIFSMIVAFAWKGYKSVYRLLVPGTADDPTRFYIEFVEQINEQKELLVAVSLLLYALYRVRLARRLSQAANADRIGADRRA
jgi:hypothetical protein